MDCVTHFEIPANDTNRAEDFYKKSFGWEVNSRKDMDYTTYNTTDTDKKTFIVKKSDTMKTRNNKIKPPIITVGVQNIDETIRKVKENGGKSYIDKTLVGDMGFAAYIKDTENNIVGLFEHQVKNKEK